VAALLAGIVALNVGVLRLNMEGERLETRQRELETDLSRKAAAGRIESIALSRLGLVRAEERSYLRLQPPKKG
jgi:hypothetical protein